LALSVLVTYPFHFQLPTFLFLIPTFSFLGAIEGDNQFSCQLTIVMDVVAIGWLQ
jgi:hypothetical protein